MILSIQKKIYSGSDPNSGQFVLAHDYLLHNHWDGKLPVNLQEMCKRAAVHLVPIIGSGTNKLVFTYGDKSLHCSLQRLSTLPLFTRNLLMATHLQFAIRKIDSSELDESGEIYLKGVKIAKHLLMPDMVMIKAVLLKTSIQDLVTMFDNQIPEEELQYQLDKIKRKFLANQST